MYDTNLLTHVLCRASAAGIDGIEDAAGWRRRRGFHIGPPAKCLIFPFHCRRRPILSPVGLLHLGIHELFLRVFLRPLRVTLTLTLTSHRLETCRHQ